MNGTREIAEIVLSSLIVLLHLFGIYLLYLAKLTTLQKTQRFFFLNLSVSEVFIFVTSIMRRIATLCHNDHLATYFRLTLQGVGFPVYYLTMISLTLDRFFAVYLNIRYHLFWSDVKTRNLLIFIWCIGILTGCIFYIMKPSTELLTAYYFTSCGILCMLTAIITYSYIAYKVIANRKQEKQKVKALNDSGPMNTRKIVNKANPPKGLYTVGLLVFTFVVFINIPDQIFAYYGRRNVVVPRTLSLALHIMYYSAFASDFFVYVFSSKPIRKIAIKKIRFGYT